MRRETCVGNSAAEVGMLAFGVRLACFLVHVLLCQAEVDEINYISVVVLGPSHDKVGGLDVAVNEPGLVHALDGSKHLEENVTRDHLGELLTDALLEVRHICALQVHHEKALHAFAVAVDELGDLQHALDALELLEELVLLLQDALRFVRLFHLDGHVLRAFVVEGLVDGGEAARAQLLTDLEALRRGRRGRLPVRVLLNELAVGHVFHARVHWVDLVQSYATVAYVHLLLPALDKLALVATLRKRSLIGLPGQLNVDNLIKVSRCNIGGPYLRYLTASAEHPEYCSSFVSFAAL